MGAIPADKGRTRIQLHGSAFCGSGPAVVGGRWKADSYCLQSGWSRPASRLLFREPTSLAHALRDFDRDFVTY